MTIQQLLDLTITKNASDLHLVVGYPPQIRLYGELMSVAGADLLSGAEVESIITALVNKSQFDTFKSDWELDFSFDFEGKARFRVNLYYQRGAPAVALRLLPNRIPTIQELGLPSVLSKIANLRQGFILVAGPTGHGKSTTLASIINAINLNRAVHIITIEDPIEYVYPSGKALISQRELLSDTKAWSNSLRAVLRDDAGRSGCSANW
jgi:twitching motility protein PilT